MMKFCSSIKKDLLSTVRKWEDSQMYKTTIVTGKKITRVFTNKKIPIKTTKNNMPIMYH